MKTKKQGEEKQFLLKGFVRCGECGRLMIKKQMSFRCQYQRYTKRKRVESFPEAELEELVWKAVDIHLQLLEDKEAVFQRERNFVKEKGSSFFRRLERRCSREEAGRGRKTAEENRKD